MSLRIISGKLKGRVITSPASEATRPTTDMWRSAIFSALDERINLNGTRVIDLYAGTGALGLECLSRGAAHITFVENSRKAAQQLRATITSFGVDEQCDVFEEDVARFLTSTTSTFDVMLADPPYAMRLGNRLRDLVAAREILRPGGLLLLEHGDTEFLLNDDRWITEWHKERSGTMATLLRWNAPVP